MHFSFIHKDLKILRRLYISIGYDRVQKACLKLDIAPPKRPADLVLEFSEDKFYLCREFPKDLARLIELDFHFDSLPREGWRPMAKQTSCLPIGFFTIKGL